MTAQGNVCRHQDGTRHGIPVNGVRIDPITRRGLALAVGSFLSCGESHVIQFLAADPSVIAMTDRSYRDLLNRADLNVADGFPVAATVRARGGETERIPGTEALLGLLRWTEGSSLRHYFYGGTEATGARLLRKIEAAYPKTTIAGWEVPPFTPLKEADYQTSADRIRQSRADFLWIGLGTPKQHIAAARLSDLGAAPVILCAGAAFDFVAGVKRRAPKWMQRVGLEWMYRLASEPRRLWRRYLVGNPKFVLGLLRESGWGFGGEHRPGPREAA